jgi:proteasome lid subunit RPN8/RPN11
MPLERAILWRPTTGGAPRARDDYPIFVEPKVLTALAEHALAASKHGVLGFLVGDLCHDDARGAPFLFVDSTVRLNQTIYGDKTNVVVSKLWERVHAELERLGGHLLGWYHSHPPQGIALAPSDIETHLLFFTRPWNVALVLGLDATGPAAAFYRPAHDALSVTTCLPFYEVAEMAQRGDAIVKTSALPWTNYVTQETVVYRSQEQADAARRTAGTAAVQRATLEILGRHAPPPSPAPAPIAPAPRPGPLANLPLLHEEPATTSPAAGRRPPAGILPRRRALAVPVRAIRGRPRRWPVVLLAGGVVLSMAAGAWWTGVLPVPRRSPPSRVETGADSVLVRLDALAETLVRAVTSYGERAALYDRRRLSCDGLQRGLVIVEEGWMAYNVQGKAGAPSLDSARARRDLVLYAGVDSVERHFERTTCARP